MSGLDTIDITNTLDYVVIVKFDNIDTFFGHKFGAIESLNKWKRYIEARTTNLAINGRFNIAAPGTKLLCFFTSTEATPTKVMWCIQNIRINDARILSLWFNSTLNIIQIISEKSETEGAFLEISEYMVKEFRTINPTKLTEGERDLLHKTFEDVLYTEVPSILEQLREENKVRQKIDQAIL